MLKRVLKILGLVIAAVLLIGGGWAGYQVHAFNSSMGRTYELPAPAITRSTDPAVLERGKSRAYLTGHKSPPFSLPNQATAVGVWVS